MGAYERGGVELFLTGIPETFMSEDDLEKFFSKFGEVTQVELDSQGSALVVMADGADCHGAIDEILLMPGCTVEMTDIKKADASAPKRRKVALPMPLKSSEPDEEDAGEVADASEEEEQDAEDDEREWEEMEEFYDQHFDEEDLDDFDEALEEVEEVDEVESEGGDEAVEEVEEVDEVDGAAAEAPRPTWRPWRTGTTSVSNVSKSAAVEPTKLFVAGLPKFTEEDDLREYFEYYGKVVAVVINRAPSGESKSFGHVNFADEEGVIKALKDYDRHYIHGKMFECLAFGKFGLTESGPFYSDRLFVSRLTESTNTNDLHDYLSEYGEVVKISPKLSRGFAFVQFQSPAAVQLVLHAYNYHRLDGKRIEVKPVLSSRGKGDKGVGKGDTKGPGKGDKGDKGFGKSDTASGKGETGKGKGSWEQGTKPGPWTTRPAVDEKYTSWTVPHASEKEQTSVERDEVFVGGLPKDMPKNGVWTYFEHYGKVKRIKMQRGYCFVQLESDKAVRKVLEDFDRHTLEGTWVECRAVGKFSVPHGLPILKERIFVGGISVDNTTEKGLRQYFEHYGPVSKVELKRGFAFVHFTSGAAVQTSLWDHAHHKLNGKWIDVQPCLDQGAMNGEDKGGGKSAGKGDGLLGKATATGDKGESKGDNGKRSVGPTYGASAFTGTSSSSSAPAEIEGCGWGRGKSSTGKGKGHAEPLQALASRPARDNWEGGTTKWDHGKATPKASSWDNDKLHKGHVGGWPTATAPWTKTVAPTSADQRPVLYLNKENPLADAAKDVDTDKVYVTGLQKHSKEKELAEYFGQYGTVKHLDLRRDDYGGCKGYAFVTFASDKQVRAVLMDYEEHKIGGAEVECLACGRFGLKEIGTRDKKRVFVGHLSPGQDEKALADHFAKYGTVEETVYKGQYAFIAFRSGASVQLALHAYSNHTVADRWVQVQPSILKGKGKGEPTGGTQKAPEPAAPVSRADRSHEKGWAAKVEEKRAGWSEWSERRDWSGDRSWGQSKDRIERSESARPGRWSEPHSRGKGSDDGPAARYERESHKGYDKGYGKSQQSKGWREEREDTRPWRTGGKPY